MEATESRQLITYDAAMQLTGLPQRTFYRRLKQGLVPIYTDPLDRRKRWLNRADLSKLTQHVEERSAESAA